MPSQFGGVPIEDQGNESQFGGIPVEQDQFDPYDIAKRYHAGEFNDNQKAAVEELGNRGMIDLTIPKWATEHPNLYGLFGASKALWERAAKPSLEVGGAAGGAIVGAPLAPETAGMSSVAGAGLGYGFMRQLTGFIDDIIAKAEGLTPEDKSLLERSSEALKDVATGATFEMGGQVVGPAISVTAKGIGKITKPILGRLSGLGTESVTQAVKSGTETGLAELNVLKSSTQFDKALRGKISGEEIVNNAKSALQDIKDLRGAAYRSKLEKIKLDQTSMTNIKNDLDREMINGLSSNKFDVKISRKVTELPTKKSLLKKELEFEEFGEKITEKYPTFGMTDKEVSEWAANIRKRAVKEYEEAKQAVYKYGKDAKTSYMGIETNITYGDELSKAMKELDNSKKTAENLLKKHKIDKAKLYVEGKGWRDPEQKYDLSGIEFDFSNSTIVEHQNVVKKALEDISSWTNNTPAGLDVLKKRLSTYIDQVKKGTPAEALLTKLEKNISNSLKKNVPEYAEMTKGYAEATTIIKDIESGLMLRKQGMTGRIVADQTLRRLLSSMKDNFVLRKDLIEALGTRGNADIMGQIAGYGMNSVLPVGLAGTGPVLIGEGLLAHLISPKLWPILLASSPRIQGEFLRLYGKGLIETTNISPVLARSLAYSFKEFSENNKRMAENEDNEKKKGFYKWK